MRGYKPKKIVCEWCGKGRYITKELNEAYQQGRADEKNRVLDILHNFYEVNNPEQNEFMDMLCMEVMREQLKESEKKND